VELTANFVNLQSIVSETSIRHLWASDVIVMSLDVKTGWGWREICFTKSS